MEITPTNTQILVCCHKECELPNDPYLLPIHVGAALGTAKLDMQRDDEFQGESCDNISAKNPSYCELTAVWWAWKHLRRLMPGLEYVGINHYRRYFDFGSVPVGKDMVVRPESEVRSYRVDDAKLAQFLGKYEVIIPRVIHNPYSTFTDYCYWRIGDDLRTTMRVIHEMCPEYDDSVYEVIMRSNKLSPYSMGIMPWHVFDEYCAWLFPVLAEVEMRCDISSYDAVQGRIYGYIAERLWNVWLHRHGTTVVQLPIVMYDSQPDVSPLKSAINVLRRDVGFCLARPSNATTRERFEAIIGN